jgi:hypothetical protein
MKKVASKESIEDEGMRSEYDFSRMKGAVREKYYEAYRSLQMTITGHI